MSATAALPTRPPRIVALARLGDETLAARAAAGNTAAFSTLCERYHAPLLAYCRSILLNDDDAHDATQAALENALRALPRREPGRPLRPWLYRIAHNESINIVRRRGATTELTELDEPSVPGPEVDSEHRVRLAQLVDDLRGLPERQRGALVMRELSGLGYDEIADALGVSNEAARRAVFDARSALHEAVDGRATDCVNVRHCISDGDRRSLRARRIRAHLRSCNDCASFQQAIGARTADLHLLGPWLSGAAITSMLGGGAGGLLAVGGGGAATVTVASWSSMPVLLKGLTVAAVVATTGGAAVELKHVAKPDNPAPRTAAARPAPAATPTAAALKARAAAHARSAKSSLRVRAAGAHSTHTSAHSRSVIGAGLLPRRETVATPPVPAAATPAPAPAATQQAPASAPVVKKAPAQNVTSKLTDLRQQVLDAVQLAQATAAGGGTGAVNLATQTLQSTLDSLRPTIDRVLATVGLKLPEPVATPAPSTTPTTAPSSPSLPDVVLAPVQQVLSGVDSLLSQLLGRSAG
ncbi:MAG: hypothetical protein QOE11_2807 [Solirubrobacteraceae bacterium]|nr:hypothetical protein [Solirubrobacteraceae bacterium]